jgi:hypothetical protein
VKRLSLYTPRSLIFFFCTLAACAGRGVPTTPYLPPTAAAQPAGFVQPVETSTADTEPSADPTEPPQTSPTPACTADLTYLNDLTIPDGTLVEPGEILDKRWQVENSGTCNWDSGYSLRLVAGPDLGAPTEQGLYPARSNTRTMIRILFTAPQEPDTYRSEWQAFDPGGNPFGDSFYIEFTVTEP